MQPANNRRHWTPGDLTTMRLLLDEGRSYADIARRLKRKRRAVFCKLMEIGISHRRHPELRSAAQVAPLFRVTTNMLCKWIERGWLPARNAGSPTTQRPYWRIHDVDILAFLENDETWVAWAPGQITEPDLRAYAYELRASAPRWIAVKEIATRFDVSIGAVQKWINLGLLPAVKYHAYYVRAEHVAAFVPPCLRKEP